MDLLGEEVLGEVIEAHELLGKISGSGETFRHEHVFADKNDIWDNHCATSEEGLKVLWKLGTSSITWVHGNEETYGNFKTNLLIEEEEGALGWVELDLAYGIEDVLDLSGYDRQYLNGDSVELIEASPRSGLGETHEDLSHGEIVHLIGAVEDDDLKTKGSTEILGGLCLTSTGWTSGGTTHGEVQGLSKGDVASIGKWGNNESTAVTNVLVVVVGRPIADSWDADLLLVLGVLQLHVELELTLPLEETGVSDLVEDERLNDISLVDINGDNGNDFNTKIVNQWGSDSLNQVLDTHKDGGKELLHGSLTTSLQVIEGSGGSLSPHDLGGEKSDLGAVVLEPLVSLLGDLPIIGGFLGSVQDVLEGGLHASLEVAEIVLDGTVHGEWNAEWDAFTLFGPHTLGALERTLGIWILDEVETLHTVEAISEILVNLNWVVTVGKNIKKGLVGDEVETGEDLLLLLEILVKSFLAELDLGEEGVEAFLSSLVGTGNNDTWVLTSFSHHFLEVTIDLLESSGVIRKLGSDILRGQEDWLETLPVSLDFNPDLDDGVNSLEGLLPVHDSLLEFLDIFGRHHTHELHGVGLDELYDLIKGSKDWDLLVIDEGEELVLPDALDDVELVLDLVLFLGAVDELSYLFGVFEKLELDEVIKAELW